jgi:hypothetical protein
LEIPSEDLLFLAYTDIKAVEEKQLVMPRIQFFLEIMKTLLDTLRSNSRFLEFYHDTARKIFEFCREFKSKKEYRKVSDTLHSHFNQILKYDRTPDNKIPNPIKLDEDEQITWVLKLRKEQLELALHLEEWTDAYRTSTDIYQLMNRASKNRTVE